MSNETLTKEERFLYANPLRSIDQHNPEGFLLADRDMGDRMITVYEADLTVAEARALRDWLNKVLP